MAYEAGSVVVLKSGGQPMTVVSSTEEDVECVWIGEEGEFFRHAIPAVALDVLQGEEDEDENDSEDESEEEEGDDEADVAEDDGDEPKGKRSAA